MQHKYMQVAEEFDLPEMGATRISLWEKKLTSPDKLIALLQKCLKLSGWICFQSGIVTLPREKLPDDLGYPLSAEVAGKKSSFRLLPDGHGGWLVSSVDESEQGDLEVMYDCVQHIGNQHAPGILQYRRYWMREDDNGYTAVTARFTGFVEEGA